MLALFAATTKYGKCLLENVYLKMFHYLARFWTSSRNPSFFLIYVHIKNSCHFGFWIFKCTHNKHCMSVFSRRILLCCCAWGFLNVFLVYCGVSLGYFSLNAVHTLKPPVKDVQCVVFGYMNTIELISWILILILI